MLRGQVIPNNSAESLTIIVSVRLQDVPVSFLVDTGASRSCLALDLYNQHSLIWGDLGLYRGNVEAADRSPILVTGVTQPLQLRWDKSQVSVPFLVIDRLSGTNGILGMDVLCPLKVQINSEHQTALPLASVLTEDITYEYPVRLKNPIKLPPQSEMHAEVPHTLHVGGPHLFTPSPKLPTGVRALQSVSQGRTVSVHFMNERGVNLILQPGWIIGTLEHVVISSVQTTDTGSTPGATPVLPVIPAHLPRQRAEELRQLLMQFQDIFAQNKEDIGRTDLVEHEIHTIGPPIRVPYRRQNPTLRQEEDLQIQQMLSQGVIRPSSSPWAAAVVMVTKKDGSRRFCMDYRKLNDVTIKDAHPLPRIDDTLEALCGSKWFSTLDLQAAYWQIPIRDQDKHKTAFRTSSGRLYESERLPFGLCNAPATCARLMDQVLQGLTWDICLAYLDDIIVFAADWAEHLA